MSDQLKLTSTAPSIDQSLEKMRKFLEDAKRPTLISEAERVFGVTAHDLDDWTKSQTIKDLRKLDDPDKIIIINKDIKPMADTLTGDSEKDFTKIDPNEVEDSIMEATKNYDHKEVKPMQEESFPKFQYSIFVDAQRNAQMVIRANTFEEFKQLKHDADSLLAFTTTSANPMAVQTIAPQAPVPQPVSQPVATNTPICGIHNTPMVWKQGVSSKTGKPYAFWSCSQRMPDGGYCQYKPPQA